MFRTEATRAAGNPSDVAQLRALSTIFDNEADRVLEQTWTDHTQPIVSFPTAA
jgi:hypothetical protein